MKKANSKEIYSACLLLLIGIIYLAAQADSLFSISSTTIKGDTIQLSKNEILSHLRTILTIILCFSGGILLLKIKKAGWIISQSVLLLLLSIATGILISNHKELSVVAQLVMGFGMFLLLLAIIFLLLKQTRQKFMITKKNYLPVFILFAILAVFYFLLQ